jgi:hypothetical protein
MLAMHQLQHGQIRFATAAEGLFKQLMTTKIHNRSQQSAEGLRISPFWLSSRMGQCLVLGSSFHLPKGMMASFYPRQGIVSPLYVDGPCFWPLKMLNAPFLLWLWLTLCF